MSNARKTISTKLNDILTELESAIRHCRTASSHFDESEVPRGCAHALAVRGHLYAATLRLDELALVHARHSSP
jgi:hypothetical protein